MLPDINEREDQESMRKSSGSDLKASKKFMQHLKNSQRQSAGKEKIHKQINEQTPY